MGQVLQDSLPAAAEWAEARVNTAVEAYNLTKVGHFSIIAYDAAEFPLLS